MGKLVKWWELLVPGISANPDATVMPKPKRRNNKAITKLEKNT